VRSVAGDGGVGWEGLKDVWRPRLGVCGRVRLGRDMSEREASIERDELRERASRPECRRVTASAAGACE
jgi:hypothetical protein